MLIAHLTDLHVRPRGQAADRVAETNMLAERALRAVARLDPAPDALLLTGDLTECGLDAEYDLLAALLRRHARVPVLAIPGNHDRRAAMIARLPGTRHDADGFVQYVAEDFPVRLVMLDTVVPGHGHGELCPRRLAWLERTLAAAPERPTAIAMHHPPFLCGIAHMDAIALREREEFAALLARHPQVGLVLCGHVHRAIAAGVAGAVAFCAPSTAHQVELDLDPGAPSTFVLEPPAYALHLWHPGAPPVTHLAYVEPFPGPFPFLGDPDYPGRQPHAAGA